MRISDLLLGGLLGGLLVLGQANTGHADEALEAAKKRYEQGELDYNNARFWQAARSFEEAYELVKRPDLLFNAARAYDRGDYAVRAIAAYQAYLNVNTDPSDRQQIEERIAVLSKRIVQLLLKGDEAGFVYLDGHEYGRTPMSKPIPIDNGYHRVEVRVGNRVWVREQLFTPGVSYEFTPVLSEEQQRTQGTGLPAEGPPKTRTRRLAVAFDFGGAIDVTSSAFPPHQALLQLGGEYRMFEYSFGAIDLALRIPLEVGSGWVNSGFTVGVRGAVTPAPRLPLELTLGLDFGFMALDIRPGAPFTNRFPCGTPTSLLATCTLYAARIHPAFGLAYRVRPALELRAELLGVEVNATSPSLDPRLTFTLGAAYRVF